MLGILIAYLFRLMPDWFLEEEKNFNKADTIEQRQEAAKKILDTFKSFNFLPNEAPLFIRSMLELDPNKRAPPSEVKELFYAYVMASENSSHEDKNFPKQRSGYQGDSVLTVASLSSRKSFDHESKRAKNIS
jgi:hypothetical protein